jgi:hypothetical protein
VLRSDAGQSSVTRRDRCKAIVDAPWYTDAVFQQIRFEECVKLRPEVEVRV